VAVIRGLVARDSGPGSRLAGELVLVLGAYADYLQSALPAILLVCAGRLIQDKTVGTKPTGVQGECE